MHRKEDYIPLEADENANYDEIININLTELTPLLSCPHSPDNIKEAKELSNIKVDQVLIGSCTNSSFKDFVDVANYLYDKEINKKY